MSVAIEWTNLLIDSVGDLNMIFYKVRYDVEMESEGILANTR
jgi:hypothetical protein